MNFPAILMLLWTEWNVAGPNGFSILFNPAMLIPYSVMAWSFIGLVAYSLIKMFRLGS